MRAPWNAAVAVLACVVLGACGPGPSGEPPPEPTPAAAPGPYDSTAEMRPDLLRVEPAAAAPGSEVALHFPQETERGVLVVLESKDGEGWSHRYSMTIPADDYVGEVDWYPAGEPLEWPDEGLGGPGPNRIVIPEPAPPGEYRVCTGNAVQNFCAPIEIVEGPEPPSE